MSRLRRMLRRMKNFFKRKSRSRSETYSEPPPPYVPPKPIRFEIGVAFRWPNSQGGTDDATTRLKHWALIVKHECEYRLIELIKEGDDCDVHDVECGPVKFSPVGIYTGDPDDFSHILENHPMRYTEYSEGFNNCQHFVATFLVFLEALAMHNDGKSFLTFTRYEDLIKVLGAKNGDLFNEANMFLQGSTFFAYGGGLALSGAAAMAADATIVVPASGLAGWLGGTTVVAAPSAAAAAFAAPVCAAVGVGAAVGAYLGCRKWYPKTTFADPRRIGFS